MTPPTPETLSNILIWLRVEIGQRYDIAERIHNEPSREWHQSLLGKLAEARASVTAWQSSESRLAEAEWLLRHAPPTAVASEGEPVAWVERYYRWMDAAPDATKEGNSGPSDSR